MKLSRPLRLLVVGASFSVLASCSGAPQAPANPAPPSPPPGGAASPDSGSADLAPHYVTEDALDPATAITPPPLAGSPEARADLDSILRLQRERTPQDCERAASEVTEGLASFFGPPYGPLSPSEISRLAPFFKRIQADTKRIVKVFKNRWSRPRPWIEDARVSPCVTPENSPSYPSGHATLSRVFADVLALIAPGRKASIDARAEEIAFDRVLGGVHHPTDIEAGKRLGDEIFQALQRSGRFEADLHAAGP